MTCSPAMTDMLRALGARPVVADALDPDAVARAATHRHSGVKNGVAYHLQGETS